MPSGLSSGLVTVYFCLFAISLIFLPPYIDPITTAGTILPYATVVVLLLTCWIVVRASYRRKLLGQRRREENAES